MKELDGKRISVGNLLSQSYFFRVPEYQRAFSWEADNFDDLIDDLTSAPLEQEYFSGTIVLHDKKEHYDVVDGQQRLTSLMILLACLRDLVDDKEYKSGIQEKILQKRNIVDGIPEKVRLEVKDRDIFHKMVITKEGTKKEYPHNQPEPEKRYVESAKIFKEKLSNFDQSQLQNLITFINQKCVVIFLSTSTFDDAFRLFTIVNDRGKQLRRIDILKSLNIAPDIIQKDTVRNRIATQWEEYEKDVGEERFESIFHLLRLILLKDKPQGDLLKEFTNRIFSKGLVSKGEKFLSTIFEYVDLYKSIFIDKDIVPERSSDYMKYRAIIHIMDEEFRASEWRACLLSFAQKYKGKEIYPFCLKLEKVYLQQWVNAIRKDERFSEYAKILGTIETKKKPLDIINSIQYDESDILKAFDNQNFYNSGYAKYFLLRLEITASENIVGKEYSAKSIEHVLPQNAPKDSEWTKDHDLTKIDEYVNTIGNLVLLSKSKNSSASNLDFENKKEKYLKPRVSDFPRSIQVINTNKWTKEVIKMRTEEAKKKFLENP